MSMVLLDLSSERAALGGFREGLRVQMLRRKKGTATDSRVALVSETMGFHERESDSSPPIFGGDHSAMEVLAGRPDSVAVC